MPDEEEPGEATDLEYCPDGTDHDWVQTSEDATGETYRCAKCEQTRRVNY